MYNVLLDDFKNNTNFQLKVLGNMKLIFVTKINNEIYYDKSYIIKNSKSNNFNLSFTKITLDNLRQEFVKN